MPTEFLRKKSELPSLGIGLGLRRELAKETFVHLSEIDWLEISPENYMKKGGAARFRLERAIEKRAVISHGLNLSIGSTDQLNWDYLQELKKILDFIKAPWWSDHLCFSSAGGLYMHDLLPLPSTKEAVKHIIERIKRVQDFIERPFLLENISYYMQMPGAEMPETDFINMIVEGADCGLLLDVNNVVVNSINHNFDPAVFINNLELDRVIEIHVAGHKRIGEFTIDTHGEKISAGVYNLLESIMQKTHIKGILLERDQNFPDFIEILTELRQLREIASKHKQLSETEPSQREASLRAANIESEKSNFIQLERIYESATKAREGRESHAVSK